MYVCMYVYPCCMYVKLQLPTLTIRTHLPTFLPTYLPTYRYADVVVHRLLAASIGVAPLPEALMDKGNLHDLAENMNRRHKAAQVMMMMMMMDVDGRQETLISSLHTDSSFVYIRTYLPTYLPTVGRAGIHGLPYRALLPGEPDYRGSVCTEAAGGEDHRPCTALWH